MQTVDTISGGPDGGQRYRAFGLDEQAIAAGIVTRVIVAIVVIGGAVGDSNGTGSINIDTAMGIIAGCYVPQGQRA